jgi:hypothetical protein
VKQRCFEIDDPIPLRGIPWFLSVQGSSNFEPYPFSQHSKTSGRRNLPGVFKSFLPRQTGPTPLKGALVFSTKSSIFVMLSDLRLH